MEEPTVFALDWSGARRPKGIWLAAVRDGELVESRPVASREEAVARVVDEPGAVTAGFDFSFSVPFWFARELGCATVEDVWERAARDGETWLRPSPPFWRERCDVAPDRRFRVCERRFPSAKSVFQLVGNGQVGAGSVRGMPLLRTLRAAGFAIWPFDRAGPRLAVEIYPRVMRPVASAEFARGPFASDDERDAVCSAAVLWEHRSAFPQLRVATEPVTRLEGDIWFPPGREM